MMGQGPLKSAFSRCRGESGGPLTPGEIAFAKSIFGDEIGDLSRIRKHLAPKHPDFGGEVLRRSHIYFYGRERHTNDYSIGNLEQYGLYIHEMTHVWQLRHRIRDLFRNMIRPSKERDYKLSPKSRFEDFGMEQQASIIQDYARECLHPEGRADQDGYYKPLHANKYAPRQRLSRLQKLVETQFPQARKTRLALEERDMISPPRAVASAPVLV